MPASSIKKVAIIGGESTGKTTLARELAMHFNTCTVPEYARQFLNDSQGDFSYDDMLHIAKTQLAHENEILPNSNEFLFCDTNVLTTIIWSLCYFNKYDDELDILFKRNIYSHYLVMAPDLPWKEDPVRTHPHLGSIFFEMVIEELNRRDVRFEIVSGLGLNRTKNAIAYIV